MDSLNTTKLDHLQLTQDSLIKKLSDTHEIVKSLNEENLFLKLLPFIGVIVGSLLAYWGQRALKSKDFEISKLTAMTAAKSKVLSYLNMLTFYLRELAYLEVDSKFQYYLSQIEEGDLKNKALEEHYNDYKYISDVKFRIAEVTSQINESTHVFFALSNGSAPQSTLISLQNLSEHLANLPRHPGFSEQIDSGINISDDHIENERKSLFATYNNPTEVFRDIAIKLK